MSPTHKKPHNLALALLIAVVILAPGLTKKATSEANTASTLLPQIVRNEVLVTPPTLSPQAQIPKVQIETETKTAKGLSLNISSIGLDIPLGTTTLDSQGHLAVPSNPNKAAWYKSGPKLGGAGTALITGHFDSAAGPGVFYNLKQVKVGDQIQVMKEDGTILNYTVDLTESYAQDNTFPWNKVYRTTGPSALRIITCDGVYNSKTGRYSRNLVVYATLN